LALTQALRTIHLQESHGGATSGGRTNHIGAVQSKVFRPKLLTWMEEQNYFPSGWINRGKIAAFMPITPPASIGQIVKACLSTMFDSNNMVNFMRKEAHAVRSQAILAGMTGTLLDAIA
jgi:hypothetical protein